MLAVPVDENGRPRVPSENRYFTAAESDSPRSVLSLFRVLFSFFSDKNYSVHTFFYSARTHASTLSHKCTWVFPLPPCSLGPDEC